MSAGETLKALGGSELHDSAVQYQSDSWDSTAKQEHFK